MNRILCVGSSSTLPAKGAVPVKVGATSSEESALNKSVHSKTQRSKSQPSAQLQRKHPSEISDGGQVKESPNRSEAGAVLQASSQADITMHAKEKLAESSPDGAEEIIVSAEKMKQDGPVLKVAQYLGVPKCPDSQSTSEEDSGEDEETAEHCAPIELLAEFLKAVMGKDYALAKKLCHMILIYEPENPEAKHFLPLIEERILIAEEAQEGSSSEDNKSDENEEESNDDENDDDDDDDDDDSNDDEDDDDESSSSSSDGESTVSKSSSDEKEEETSYRAPLPL